MGVGHDADAGDAYAAQERPGLQITEDATIRGGMGRADVQGDARVEFDLDDVVRVRRDALDVPQGYGHPLAAMHAVDQIAGAQAGDGLWSCGRRDGCFW